MPEWWQDFFTGLWVEAQLGLWTREESRADADRVERALHLEPGSDVLDAPCGDGRISLELAARGHRLTGVDLNPTFLAAAERAAEERGLSVRWVRSDLRELPFESRFDAVVNFNGSFGYFDAVGDERAAGSAYLSLVDGGRFLIDIPTTETVLSRFEERRSFTAETIEIERVNRYDAASGRIQTDWTLVASDGRRETRTSSMRLYAFDELGELLRRVGFSEIAGFDAHDLAPFHAGATRLILVATR